MLKMPCSESVVVVCVCVSYPRIIVALFSGDLMFGCDSEFLCVAEKCLADLLVR